MEISSNIICDEKLCKRFYKEASKVTNSLKYRYFSVFEQMTVEDIVMECYVKILKGDISYDDSKGCKFETFVRMIVTCQLTDELKRLSAAKRSGIVVSLDTEYAAENDEDSATLYNTISDEKSLNAFEYYEVKQDLNEIENELYGSFGEHILELSEYGYSVTDIANLSDTDRKELRERLNTIKRVYMSRCNELSMRMSEILYGDDDIRELRGEYLISIANHMIDDITGVRLSDIVKLVFKDYSYKGISEKLNISVYDVKRVLSKYESVMV